MRSMKKCRFEKRKCWSRKSGWPSCVCEERPGFSHLRDPPRKKFNFFSCVPVLRVLDSLAISFHFIDRARTHMVFVVTLARSERSTELRCVCVPLWSPDCDCATLLCVACTDRKQLFQSPDEAGDTVSATPPVMYPPVGVSGPTTVDLRRSARSETRLQHTHRSAQSKIHPNPRAAGPIIAFKFHPCQIRYYDKFDPLFRLSNLAPATQKQD